MDKSTTTRGTPCSQNWDPNWIAYVDAVEADLDRHICGARTRTGDCCTMQPTHSNGRCRFHGGIEAYGGKEANTHALRTGLYSFRLRPCSVKCPMWTKCPFAGDDVMQLPDRERPACAYEQQEYDDALAEITAAAAPEENDGPETIAARDSLTRAAGPYAMARVMTLRASMALAEESLVNVTHVNGELPHSRVSGHAEVFLRLDRALRAREQHVTQAIATIARTRRQHAERTPKNNTPKIPSLSLQMLEVIEEEERLKQQRANQTMPAPQPHEQSPTKNGDCTKRSDEGAQRVDCPHFSDPCESTVEKPGADGKWGLTQAERGASGARGLSHFSDLPESSVGFPPTPPIQPEQPTNETPPNRKAEPPPRRASRYAAHQNAKRRLTKRRQTAAKETKNGD